MKTVLPEPIRSILKRFLHPVPSHLRQNWIRIDNDALESIKTSIVANYHAKVTVGSPNAKAMLEKDLQTHLHGRLEKDRTRVVPWLDSAKSLMNSDVLEIGCGTGSSTVALAEQGARVVGIDVDEGSLVVAKERCEVYRLDVTLKNLNASELPSVFPNTRFDVIIFFASLEHMTIDERITSLRSAWDVLHTGGILAVVETPNRLWYHDSHTSLLPFFHWLPNELAFKYSCYSPREGFREHYREYDPISKKDFLRRGRGVSFHEIEIAIKPVRQLRVISSRSTFEGIRSWMRQPSLDRHYMRVLKKVYPGIHPGFYERQLYLIIEKDE